MKDHAIIPIFIPHSGCPNDCVFCNQKIITAKSKPVSPEDVKNIIDTHLATIAGRGLSVVEIAFFGGSFTGIPIDMQSDYLKIAKIYKDKKLVDKIHLSTRPDYIDKRILDNLKKYSVDVIELGVQSFDEEVLKFSKRGHSVDAVYKACGLIKEYGFTLGIQLMIGLPKDTEAKSVASAKKAAELKPDLARLYPTVILENTELAFMYQNGCYKALSEKEAVNTCKQMYRILTQAGITVMRVGLKSTDLITNNSDLGGNYHPAFRQLVEGEIAKEDIIKELSLLTAISDSGKIKTVTFATNPKTFSNMIGHKGINKKFFKDNYPQFNIRYKSDKSIAPGVYKQIEVTG